jgi:hypothetical protein
VKFIGNCSDIINWDTIIEPLSTRPGIRTPGEDSELYDENGDPKDKRPLHYASSMMLKNAGYHTLNTIEWYTYLPTIDFDNSAVDKFSEFVNTTALCVWISSVKPGRCIPYHWDFDYGEYDKEILENKDRLLRYTCHISRPKFGHIFATENMSFYNEPQGNTYLWDNLDLYHGGSNFGLEPKFLFNFIGYAK